MEESPVWIGSISTGRLGEVWVAVSTHGLIAVEYGVLRREFEATTRKLAGSDPQFSPAPVKRAAQQIMEYVQGRRRAFDFSIDWSSLCSDFHRSVLQAVFSIPYGETRTYGQIAAQIGHPAAPRAVGRANATNPMPLVIPCHRVIGSDGKLHGYGGKGGLKTKEWLLRMEGAL